MNRSTIRAFAILPFVLVLASCDDPVRSEDDSIHVAITLSSPHADDRALLLRITGPVSVDSASATQSGAEAFTRPATEGGATVAVFGSIVSGEILTFRIPSQTAVESLGVQLLEAAGPAGSLRDVEEYELLISTSPPSR